MSTDTEFVAEQNAILGAEHQLIKLQEIDMDTQLKAAGKILGYKKLPPTIDEFIENDYYLGNVARNLYPFWREQLRDIFPTPIHTRYPILVITGSIGSGKSTFSRICAEYQMCRLDHLIDVHRSLGIMPGKKLVFQFLMPNKANADVEFPGTIANWNELSPYFNGGMMYGMDRYELATQGLRGLGAIGRDVIFYVLSELNFIGYEKAFDLLDTALKRWTSRFQRFTDYFGQVIIDTSSKDSDSIAEDFAANNPYGDKVKLIHTREWTVKKHLNYYFKHGSFKVYTGDSLHSPFIVSDTNPVLPEMDQERVLDVPEELRPDFEFSLEKALMDKAGVAIQATDRYITDFSKIESCFNIRKSYRDVIDVDFFDPNDKLIYQLQEAVNQIPKDRILFIHYDIGVTGDNTGLAVGYFDKWIDYGENSENKRMKLPYIKVPIVVGIGRKKDQQTSIFKLQEFVVDLSERNEVYFSADQFASRQLLQNLEYIGINTKYISVDRTDSAYIYLKTLMMNHIIDLPQNEILKREIAELRRVGNKFDHPSTGNGSKDTSDATAGVVQNIYLNLETAGQLSSTYIASGASKAVQDRGKRPTDKFQDMINTIYG